MHAVRPDRKSGCPQPTAPERRPRLLLQTGEHVNGGGASGAADVVVAVPTLDTLSRELQTATALHFDFNQLKFYHVTISSQFDSILESNK